MCTYINTKFITRRFIFMDNLTDVLGAGAALDTTDVATDKGNEEKKAKLKEMKDALKATVQSEPDFTEKLRRLSNSLKVVKTLGYGDNGNIIVDKQASSKDNRVLKATSQIVGYKIQNIGNEPISYDTEVFTKDETGKFVGSVQTRTMQPGETIVLTRAYTTVLCSRPEISFTLANGKIVSSARKSKKDGNLKDTLAAYYFSFNKDESAEVNDDSVKERIDVDKVVKDEFVEVFGYLNNPKESRGVKTKTGSQFTTQDLAANYINKLLQSNGGI